MKSVITLTKKQINMLDEGKASVYNVKSKELVLNVDGGVIVVKNFSIESEDKIGVGSTLTFDDQGNLIEATEAVTPVKAKKTTRQRSNKPFNNL